MTQHFLDLMGTKSVRAAQEAMRSPFAGQRGSAEAPQDRLGPDEAYFIATRDSFYMASVTEHGWPYVQHRGGPAGFLKLLDDRTLAFADFRGNRQYLSLGNLTANDRVALFLIDYPSRSRLKILAHAEILAPHADPELLDVVTPSSQRARVERIFKLRLEAFDWNCPQHITPRFTKAQIEEAVQPMRERLAALEEENAALRARLEALETGKAQDDER